MCGSNNSLSTNTRAVRAAQNNPKASQADLFQKQIDDTLSHKLLKNTIDIISTTRTTSTINMNTTCASTDSVVVLVVGRGKVHVPINANKIDKKYSTKNK